jgi:outer membrane protein OmpA-like peptidoglycan-associated protein
MAVATLARADAAHQARDDQADIEHLAYMAARQLTLAQETSAAREAESVVEKASAERDALRLALRTAEADAVRRQLATSEEKGRTQGAALAQAGRDAAAQRSAIAQGDARVGDLEAELKQLNARQTERGIVVTLGDMLFESGQAQVLPAGTASVAGLAEFMRRNPNRQAAVEGHTDSQGSALANQALSERRAQAVQAMLVGMGIDATRLQASGRGEAEPVASNASAAGRRSNRRVEIVLGGGERDLLRR